MNLPAPPHLHLHSQNEYRAYFEKIYCRRPIETFDGIQVKFKKTDFDHCMFESTKRNNIKDLFSVARAERLEWIRATLENSKSELYQGWDREKRKVDPDRRVAVAYENFVVVIKTYLNPRGVVKAKFITAYNAETSIEKIRSMPKWEKTKCRWFARLAQRRRPL